jgi:pyruvate,water dikinase
VEISKLIISLHKTKESDLPQVGYKALSLARMKQLGLIVPAGFCITAGAFQEHLETNNLLGCIKSAVGELNSASLEKRKSVLLEIRQAIINAPLAVDLRSEIENHYKAFVANRVAVRSSATAEDLPAHSFAGQYETYLGIADLAGCIDAVKKCWASLWTARAYDYCQKNGFDHLAINMAVIVQTLVEADASGVIFTADPVNGYQSRVIIETVCGLGDSLVSGKVTPQRFVVAREKYRIVSRNVTSEPCLTDSAVTKLAKLGKKIEKHFNSPQDIEWAIRDNKIFFLQTRPITTIPQQKSWEERQVWTNANAGEAAPDVITPFTWSFIQTMLMSHLFGSVSRLLGVKLGDNPLGDLVAGRIYFNVNTCMAIVRRFPKRWQLRMNDAFGGDQGKMYDMGEIDIPEEDIPDVGFRFTKVIFMLPYIIYKFFSHRQKKAESFLNKMISKYKQLQNLDIQTMSEEELITLLMTIISICLETFDILYVIPLLFALPPFYWLCARWLDDTDSTIANRLLAGLGNMDDVEAGLDLWRLAIKAHELTEVEKIILSDDNWQAAQEKIKKLTHGSQFLRSWDEFMVRHGHHCHHELELFNPRWSEQPDYILSMVRNYIVSIDKSDPLKYRGMLIEQRIRLTEECRRKLTNPVKCLMFNYSLRRAQRGSILREKFKNEPVRSFASLHKVLLELGKRLNIKGTLVTANDIFFLKLEEIVPLAQNKADFDIKKTIASRRAEYEKNKSVIPPNVVIGKFDPDNFVPDAVDTDIDILDGLAVSSGIVTGKARVILRADIDEQVLPSEILVAPITNPGWTPYFIPAAAIVMDMGGMLSHGSIIAREYGIPAVVNVGPATKIIKTGQTIQVDANKGVVKIC